MTANPLKVWRAEQNTPHMTAQDWCDRANAHAASIGRGHEIHWTVQNGRPCIGWKGPPQGNRGA